MRKIRKIKQPLSVIRLSRWEDVSELLVYFYLFLFPIRSEASIQEVITYYSLTVILFMSLVWSRRYPNYLEEEMILCPLSKMDRRNFLMSQYWRKVLGNSALFIIGASILLGLNFIHLVGFFMLLVFCILWNLVNHLYVDTSALNKEQGHLAQVLRGHMVWQAVNEACFIIIWNVLSIIAMDDTLEKWEINLGIGLIGILFLLSIKLIKKYGKALFEYGISGESVYFNKAAKKENIR